MDIVEIPIETIYEAGNKTSHFNPIIDSIKIYLVIVKYSISSILSALVDYFVFGILILLGYPVANSTYISRTVAAVINFVVNRNVVFKTNGNILVQLIKYIMLCFASGTVSWIFIWYIRLYVTIPVLVCKVFVEMMLFFFNYYVQRKIIFTK